MIKEEGLIISHLKHYGFINQNAEIYQGLAKSWDFGINGAELKRKLKNLWWDYFITSNPYNFPCETSIMTHKNVLEASGHKKNFSDWIIECLGCKKRFRLDNIISEKDFLHFLSLSNKEKGNFEQNKKCSLCKNNFSPPKQFNLMLKTNISSFEKNLSDDDFVYLRPETCQGIFINFPSLRNSINKKIPFGIGQIGKSFRNEVTLNHGIFRTREFEQAELEFFVLENKEEWWNYWIDRSWKFFNRVIENELSIKKKEVERDELPHYSLRTLDLYFNYKFGWGEICSISDRGDYDLKNHSEKSSQFLGIENEKKEKVFPNIVEVSFGIERIILAILENSYKEETVKSSNLKRIYLKINHLLAPFYVSVMPLSRQLNSLAYKLYLKLIKKANFSVSYEETGNIGNRYRRQDAIGTPICITIDFETEKNKEVTIRERDTMKQERVSLEKLEEYLLSKINKLKEKFLE
jgi:glycyl-tRNA synthetase